MLKIAQRYLAATFIPPFVVSTIFFVCFLLIFQLFRLIEIVINNNVQSEQVLEIIFHIAISFLPMAFPLAAFFAIIYTMNKMSEDSEIVAMRAFGMSKKQLLMPFMILGLFISTSIYFLNSELIPYSKSTFRNMVIKLTSDGVLSDIRSENFFVNIPGVTLFAQEVSEDGNQMEEIFIHVKEGETSQRVIHAQTGALIRQSDVEFATPRVRMHLENGNMIQTNFESGEIEKIIFKEYDFPIISSSSIPGFVTKDSMRTNKELRESVATDQENLKKNTDEAQRKRLLTELAKSKLQIWSRYNTPLQCLLFIFVGFSLGIKQSRESKKNSGVAGLVVLISYYALYFGLVSQVKKGAFPAELGVLLPSVIVFFIGLYYYKKLDWLS